MATGHVDFPVFVRNRGPTACALEGYADVSILDGQGQVLAQASGAGGRGTFFADAPVGKILMEPGTTALPTGITPGFRAFLGQAYINVEWYDCGRRQASTLVMGLPNGGGRLSVPFAFAGPYSPVCDSPGYAGRSSLARGPLSAAGVNFSPQPQYIAVTVTISAPATVHRGSTLAYTVTITNRSELDYRLDPCPDFNEIVGTQTAVSAQYQLNCGPVVAISAASSATFAMRIDIPATMPTGTTRVSWTLLDGRVAAASGNAPIDVVGTAG